MNTIGYFFPYEVIPHIRSPQFTADSRSRQNWISQLSSRLWRSFLHPLWIHKKNLSWSHKTCSWQHWNLTPIWVNCKTRILWKARRRKSRCPVAFSRSSSTHLEVEKRPLRTFTLKIRSSQFVVLRTISASLRSSCFCCWVHQFELHSNSFEWLKFLLLCWIKAALAVCINFVKSEFLQAWRSKYSGTRAPIFCWFSDHSIWLI